MTFTLKAKRPNQCVTPTTGFPVRSQTAILPGIVSATVITVYQKQYLITKQL
jgi:hypothetical protein